MRPLAIIAMLLIASTVSAQDANTTLPADFVSAQQIEVKAFDVVDRIRALEERVKALQQTECKCTCDCSCSKQAQQQTSQPASQWKIVMESIPNCNGCKWADENQRPQCIASGWQWETKHLAGPEPGKIYPRYLICDGNTCEAIDLDRFVNEFYPKLQALLARRQGQPVQDKRGRFMGNW